MQKISPRFKLVFTLAILLVIAFSRSILLIACFYLISLLLACLSRINLFYFIKRVWFFIPFFALIIAVPALFEIFSPGEVIVFGITQQGVSSGGLFTLRVLTSVSWSVLLVLTTNHTQLLRSLRLIGVPAIFVTTLMMCYRYIYVFIKIVEDMYLGIKSRTITSLRNKKARKVVAWHMGSLWEKSRMMSEEIYLAMLARGFNGEPKVMPK
ncbi:MAG: cobalt ECF transporter T component CbiQ [Candidatus Omnitrophota bacterium]